MTIGFFVFSTIMTIFYLYALIKMWKNEIGNRFVRFFIISEVALRYAERSAGIVEKKIKGLITVGTFIQVTIIWVYVAMVLSEPSSYSYVTLLGVFLIPIIISILAKMIFKCSEP